MSKRASRRGRVVAGLSLIVLGLSFYALRAFEGFGEAAVFMLLGGGFLAGYLYWRAYGLLVPAGVLLGLGTGLLAQELLSRVGEPMLLGLAGGFFAIYLVPLLIERRSHWWPLIPGTALVLIGIPDAHRLFELLQHHWPLILVAIGVTMLVGAMFRPAAKRAGNG